MTEPLRPLAAPGTEFWVRAWEDRVWSPADAELLQITCEQIDERANLRVRVLRDNVADERKALRELDRLVVTNLTQLGFFRQPHVASKSMETPSEAGW